MSFLRGVLDSRSRTARRALDERRLEDAERLLLEITNERPSSAPDWWNLGLVYKFQKRWRESLKAFVRSAELDAAPEAFWNAGVAATALRDWTMARWAWRRLEFDVGPGGGPPEADFGACPVRLNPDAEGEVVWGIRIDPCRVRIKSVPLPESGHRWDDVVLHDVVPRGTRMHGDREVGVFDELERMDPSPHPTLQAELRWARPQDEQELDGLFAGVDVGAENWSSSIQMLCAQCSVSSAHVHDAERPEEIRLRGTWGFGGNADVIRSILATWSAQGDGRTVSGLEQATARGRDVDHRLT